MKIRIKPAREELAATLEQANAEAAAQSDEAENKTDGAENAAEGDSDFEQFLLQFPDADAEQALIAAIKSGDYRRGCFTRAYVRNLKEQLDAANAKLADDDALADLAINSEKAAEKVVLAYLRSIAEKGANRPYTGGTAPEVQRKTPATIREAGKLAGDIFANVR